jgi:hypothetical protein
MTNVQNVPIPFGFVAKLQDPLNLQEESSTEVKERLALEDNAEMEPKYLYFQLTDHRNPEGNEQHGNKFEVTRSVALILYSRMGIQMRISVTGFGSYVGEVIRTLPSEGLVELKYRFCWSGHRRFFRNTFTPRMFHYIARINHAQYVELQQPSYHPDFDPSCEEEHAVSKLEVSIVLFLIFLPVAEVEPNIYKLFSVLQTLSLDSLQSYLYNCKVGNYLYYELLEGGAGIGIIRQR